MATPSGQQSAAAHFPWLWLLTVKDVQWSGYHRRCRMPGPTSWPASQQNNRCIIAYRDDVGTITKSHLDQYSNPYSNQYTHSQNTPVPFHHSYTLPLAPQFRVFYKLPKADPGPLASSESPATTVEMLDAYVDPTSSGYAASVLKAFTTSHQAPFEERVARVYSAADSYPFSFFRAALSRLVGLATSTTTTPAQVRLRNDLMLAPSKALDEVLEVLPTQPGTVILAGP